MNLEELRSVRRTERESSQLQHLRDSFYRDVADFIESRKDEYRRRMAEAEDPFAASEDLERLKDEVSAAEEVSEAIYERRVGKVVKMAAFAAADMSADEDGMTSEERELFEDLVERIRGNRARVLDTLAGEVPAGPGSDVTDATDPGDSGGASDPGDRPVAGSTADGAGSATPPAPEPDATAEADEGGGGGGVLSDAMGGPDPGADAGVDPEPDSSASPAPGRETGSTDGGTPGATDADPVDAAVGGDDAADARTSPGGEPGESFEPESSPHEPSEAAEARENATGARRDAAGESPSGTRADGEAEAVVGTPPGSESGSDPEDAGGRDAAVAGAVDGGGAVGTESGAAADAEADAGADRVTVRVTRDVGAIFGVDEREYDLASEDVVTLPATNAAPLVDRGAAERLE